jgi:hypothetical protein
MDPNAKEPLFLVVECKRVNPALKCWAFVKTPYVRRNSDEEFFIREAIHYRENNPGVLAYADIKKRAISEAYRIGRELKVPGQKGDVDGGAGKEAIEDAATQVSLGLNGLIEHFTKVELARGTDIVCQFIPVIVTTAQLFVADVDLKEGSLETGEIPKGGLKNWHEKEWLFYQYPVSPGIRHTLRPTTSHRPIINILTLDLGASIEAQFVRTIAIVQGKHFESFLGQIANKF